MRTFLLTIRFDGAHFVGWQVQKNGFAVMQCLQQVLEKVLKEKLQIKGCSRTDSGVHGLNFCVSFQTESRIPVDRMVTALNCKLPDSLVAVDCCEKPNGFHARYSAVGKQYLYKILNTPQRDPFWSKRALYEPIPLNEQAMNAQCKAFIGYHDFRSFMNAGSKIEDTRRTIYSCKVWREGELVLLSVTGDGFLYNMVRIMVGTLLHIEKGFLPKESIPDILKAERRTAAGVTVPPHALYLNKVYYSEEELLKE